MDVMTVGEMSNESLRDGISKILPGLEMYDRQISEQILKFEDLADSLRLLDLNSESAFPVIEKDLVQEIPTDLRRYISESDNAEIGKRIAEINDRMISIDGKDDEDSLCEYLTARRELVALLQDINSLLASARNEIYLEMSRRRRWQAKS